MLHGGSGPKWLVERDEDCDWWEHVRCRAHWCASASAHSQYVPFNHRLRPLFTPAIGQASSVHAPVLLDLIWIGSSASHSTHRIRAIFVQYGRSFYFMLSALLRLLRESVFGSSLFLSPCILSHRAVPSDELQFPLLTPSLAFWMICTTSLCLLLLFPPPHSTLHKRSLSRFYPFIILSSATSASL